jgi:hypothetical protein
MPAEKSRAPPGGNAGWRPSEEALVDPVGQNMCNQWDTPFNIFRSVLPRLPSFPEEWKSRRPSGTEGLNAMPCPQRGLIFVAQQPSGVQAPEERHLPYRLESSYFGRHRLYENVAPLELETNGGDGLKRFGSDGPGGLCCARGGLGELGGECRKGIEGQTTAPLSVTCAVRRTRSSTSTSP